YILALKRYKWAGIAGFLGVLGASSVVAIQPPPEEQFQSEGVLVQNAPVVSFTATGVELQQQGQGFITEDFLLSDIVLQQALQKLSQQGFQLEPSDIRANVGIDIDEDDDRLQNVTVSYLADNPEEAEAVLNVLFQGMVEVSSITNRARLNAIVEALNERLPGIEEELRRAEQVLEAYDRLEGPAIQAALDGSLLSAISNSQNQRRQNLITLAGIEAQMRSLQSQLGLTPEEAYASSALSSDPILAQLRARIYEAETQRELLSQDLRPAHPTMIELDKSLVAYEELLQERATEVIGGTGRLRAIPSGEAVRQNSTLDPARAELANQLVALQTELEALVQQQRVLAQSEVQLRDQYARLPNKQLERDRLAQQVALKRALYDQIQAKRIDAQAAEAETVSSLSIASPPSTTLVPVEANNPVMVLLIGALLGVVVGGAIVYLLDMLDSTIRTYEDLDKLFEDQDVPLLGLIPEMSSRSRQPAMALITDPNHPCNDIYERLRSNLQFSGVQMSDGKVPHTILITSTRDQEGKTTTAFNLGIASARVGRRTLIVEMDFRAPSRAGRLGVKPDEQAVLEPLRYYGGHLSDPIHMVPGIENLYVSPSVGPQRNPAAILDSSEMLRFLKDVKARFDFVILDVPHLTSSNDAMLLEPKSDGMIVVSRPDFTEKPVLTTALEQVEENGDIKLLGAVINGAKIPIDEAQRKEEEFTSRNDLENEDNEVRAEDVPVFTSIDF
ncbi:MAG: polysaccharide biosynthesis tyrosine autokinase, partial [Leptolyngbya sp. SIO1D8]|nr:polysaccharide biosynthesis tyrosine autokinase [Leptolyngbya sp. SIO1D8]